MAYLLLIEDDSAIRTMLLRRGPGFPVGSVVRRGASGGGSTGLGPDIARRAAEFGGGTMHLEAGPGGGARARLELAEA